MITYRDLADIATRAGADPRVVAIIESPSLASAPYSLPCLAIALRDVAEEHDQANPHRTRRAAYDILRIMHDLLEIPVPAELATEIKLAFTPTEAM